MKKAIYRFLLCCVTFPVQADSLGTELVAETVHEFYQQCNDKTTKFGKLVEMLEVDKPQFCGCVIAQIQKQFDKANIEQRLNQGYITVNQLMQEMSEIGGKASEYCVDKFVE